MIEFVSTGLLLGGGLYLFLLGTGRIAKPLKLKGNDEIEEVILESILVEGGSL